MKRYIQGWCKAAYAAGVAGILLLGAGCSDTETTTAHHSTVTTTIPLEDKDASIPEAPEQGISAMRCAADTSVFNSSFKACVTDDDTLKVSYLDGVISLPWSRSRNAKQEKDGILILDDSDISGRRSLFLFDCYLVYGGGDAEKARLAAIRFTEGGGIRALDGPGGNSYVTGQQQQFIIDTARKKIIVSMEPEPYQTDKPYVFSVFSYQGQRLQYERGFGSDISYISTPEELREIRDEYRSGRK